MQSVVLNTIYAGPIKIKLPESSFSLESKFIKLTTQIEGIKITILNCYENKLSKTQYYSIPFLKTCKVKCNRIGDYSFDNDLIVYCYMYIIFLKKYDLVFPQSELFVISGYNEHENACWNGSYLIFGNGCINTSRALVSPCIVAHELTHGLICGMCDLTYNGESGSINEFYADLFGIMFEKFIFFKCRNFGFEIGSELFRDNHSFRSYIDPHASNMPCSITDEFYYNGTDYHGGVHCNVTIPGHLFYRMSLHEEIKNVFLLFIKVFHKLKSDSNFMDFKILLLNEIRDFNFLEEIKLISIINSIL